MIRWYIFLREGKPVDLGILDSNMESLLEKDLFCLYKKTYPAAEYDSIRQSCDSVVEIWHIVGNRVADLCRYEYPRQEEADMREFIQNLINQKAQEQKN